MNTQLSPQEAVRTAEGALILLMDAARGNVSLTEHNLQHIYTAIHRPMELAVKMETASAQIHTR